MRKDAVAIRVGTLQVADGLWNYYDNSIGYRCLRYKYQEAALQVAGTSGGAGHATPIDLHQPFGDFWKRSKKIRVLIQVKKAFKMS